MSSPRIAAKFARDIAGWYGDVGRIAEKKVLNESQQWGREAARFGSPDQGSELGFLSGPLRAGLGHVEVGKLAHPGTPSYPYVGYWPDPSRSGFSAFSEDVNAGRMPGFDMHAHPPLDPLRGAALYPTQTETKAAIRRGVAGPLTPSLGDASVWLQHYDPVRGDFVPRPEIRQTAYIHGSQPHSLLAQGTPEFDPNLSPADLYKIISTLNSDRSLAASFRRLSTSPSTAGITRDYGGTVPELWGALHTDQLARAGVPMTFEDRAPFGKGLLQDALSDFYKSSDRHGEGFEQGGPVNTPTEGEGGLYAAPNSTFDTPPPYEWGYRPGGAHADGGPVEMGGGGPLRKAAQKVRDALLGDLPEYKQGEETYLRYGKWPKSERSNNFATGHAEDGVSVYPLDHHGGLPLNWSDEGEYADRVATHMTKYNSPGDGFLNESDYPRFLVQGERVGSGHDGEPLIQDVSPLSREWHSPQLGDRKADTLSRYLGNWGSRMPAIVKPFDGAFAHGGPVEMQTGGSKLIKQAAGYLRSSRLGDLKNEIATNHGADQARRFEQAADSANLERFDNNALRGIFGRGDSGLYTTMPPGDFEKFASMIPEDEIQKTPYSKWFFDRDRPLLRENQTYPAYMDKLNFVSQHQGGLNQVPFLNLRRSEPFRSVVGHEGRHRMRMLNEAGESDALVHLRPENFGRYDDRVERLMQQYFPQGSNTPYVPQGEDVRPLIQFPKPVFERGGPVEMATGGTTPTSTGGQYQPRESEGPGFFRNQDNYENSDAGNIKFIKDLVQGLSPAQREAQRLVSEATKKSGKEALVFGRGENPADLAKLTQGTYENVSIPGNYAQYALQSADPFFSFHTHGTNTLSPSAADLRIWGATQPGTIGLPYQSMFINASPQDSLLRIGEPGKWMDSDAQRIVQEVLNLKNKNEDLVANHGFMDPRMREFWKGNKLPDLAHTFHAESDQMPGVKSYLDKKIPGAAQGASMRDLYAGNFLQRIAELGIPVDVSAEHRIAGTPYLAQDVWPEFAAHVKKHALPKAEGGPVEMSTGGQYDAPESGGYIRNNLEDMYAGDPTQAIRGGIRTRLARQHQMDTPKGKAAPPDPRIQTVRDPERMVYPGIYKDPDVIAEEASKRLMRDYGKDGPMYRLFGQTRSSLDELSQGRDLEGMRPWPLRQAYTPPAGSTGSAVSDQVLTPRNARRLLDIHGEAMKYPGLRETRSWYEMSPLYQRMEELGIPLDEQRLFNQRTGIFSAAASPVSEINRGTLAHHLAQQGRIEDFIKYGGVAEKNRASILGFPEDIMDMKSHAYHGTAQAPTLAEIEMSGGYWPKEHKVGTYIGATDPEFPNYTRPIADSHIARGVGYADVRPGKLANVKANLSNPEYTDFYPWWENKIAGQTGLRPRDEQAFMWNVLGPQTGVRYIGPSKLELMSNQMMKASKRLGVAPDVARDMVLRGEAGAYKEGGTVEDQYHPIWQQSFAGGGQPDRPDKYDNAVDAMYPWLSMDASSLTPEPDRSYDSEPSGINTIEGNLVDSLYGGRITPTAEERYDRRKSREAYRAEHPEGVYSTDPLRGILGMIGKQRAGWSADQAEQYPEESSGWQRAGDQLGHLGRTFAHDVTGGLSDKLVAALSSGDYPVNVSREAAATRSSRDQLDPYVRAPMSVLPYMLSPAQQLAQYGMTTASNLMEPAHGAIDWARKQFDKSMLGLARPVSEAVYGEMKPSFTRPQWDKGYGFDHGGPVGYAGGGHAKDTGNTFDFLGPFGAGLNIIADGIGALGGEDFELDKALGYLGEIGGSLVAPGVGGALGRGAGTMAAHLIEPGEGDVGRDALNAGYGALRGGMGMFFAGGGPVGFEPPRFGPQGRDDQDPNDLTRFLAPPINPSVEPDPMDQAAANGIPGAVAPPLQRDNSQQRKAEAEGQRLMAQAEASSKQALQSQNKPKGGGGLMDMLGPLLQIGGMMSGMGGVTAGAPLDFGMGGAGRAAAAGMPGGFMPGFESGGPVPAPDGQQPWMYGNGALMARGGYLRGCGGMNG